MSSSAPSASDSSDVVLAASKRQFLAALDRETQTTLKVLRAYPPDKLDLKPTEKNKSARDLAWFMAIEFGLADAAMKGEMKLGGKPPAAPDDYTKLVDTLAERTESLKRTVAAMPERALLETVQFPTGPKQIGEYRKVDFLWFLLHDQIHHRGQFTIYLRLAGGHVPSVYGPTADEPWS